MRGCARVSAAVVITFGVTLSLPSNAAGQETFKLAFFNIQSGKGEVGFPGRPVLFADTQNCTDRTLPVNAWGVGFVQAALTSAIADDPSMIALGLAEAWTCGSAENVRALLGWAARTSTRNGVAVVARYGLAGPEQWQQLDTSLNPVPTDTMWVVRVPVCANAGCSRSVLMYAAHWYGTGTHKRTVYDTQARQTLTFMQQTAAATPHVLIGDLNAWEATDPYCGQTPTNAGVGRLRDAQYIDAWPAVHGAAEGFTGMTNRTGCGVPAGYVWKRIDYSWSSPGLLPIDITRFATPAVPGDAAASDHYGIIATYPMPDTTPQVDAAPPVATLVSPADGAEVTGTMTIDVAAADNVAVARVEVLEDGIVRHVLTAAPYRLVTSTTRLSDGLHTMRARAYDAAGNVGLSAMHSFRVRNLVNQPSGGSGDIVLHARRATVLRGSWRSVADASAAGGAALANPNAGAAKLTSALASPVNYFEMTFEAEPHRAYHVWLRGRAQSDAWSNDSVFLQFSGSVTVGGSPVYRIGTTSATTVNLEDGAGAGLSGWGWQDDGYGINVFGAALYFDGATQTVRVQVREDGMSIDQIVLSPATYFSTSPGSLKRDTTILAESTAAPAFDEIVVRASAPAVLAGAWRVVAEPAAADGVTFAHPDAGAAKLAAALAAPINYVDLRVQAEAGRPYRLWLRGSAERNAWANDSVFVQFSGSIAADGTPIHRLGTTQSVTVNLEDAFGTGLSGWGWQDNGYGTGVLGELITFATTGWQTIRIQTREDGFRFDQLVLSSGRYLTAAPGLLKNDTTILR